MNNDKRSLLAIALCVLFYLGYDRYLKAKYPEYGKRSETASSPGTQPESAPVVTPTSSAAPNATDITAPAVETLSADDLLIQSDTVVYRFSQALGGLERVTLKDFKMSKVEPSAEVELLDQPLAMQGIIDAKTRQPVVNAFRAERQGQSIRFIRNASDIEITQEYTVPEKGYGAALKISFANKGAQPIDLTAGLLFQETAKSKKSSSIMGFIPGVVVERVQLIYRADGSTEWKDLEKYCKDDDALAGSNVSVSYMGIDRHYFLGVFEPKAKSTNYVMTHGMASESSGCPITLVTFDPQGSLAPGQSVSLDFGLYFGPKSLPLMKEHSPDLESAMHLGVFDFIARPLLLVIEGFKQITGNYGVSIILLTFLLKVLFYPLVRASSVSAYKMRKLNPEVQKLREKYKDDKPRQQQEMMKLWVEHKVNPMKGCLPILPQIPVFFAFYQVLQNSIQLRHAPFGLWIHDLSAMDPFFVTPLLMGVAMMVQQRLTPTTGMDKTQEKILMFMPIMFTAMMLTLPAGLTLYMLTNTVTGIVQQKWLYHKLNKAGV